MASLKIGFIGLGVMGSHMAGHLARAGHSLTLLDANPSTAEQLAESLGGSVRAVRTPREVAETSEIVVTMLPNGQVVQKVVLGSDGLIHGMKPNSILLDTSSCEPWLTQETGKALAARGASMVDSPVSGAQPGAMRAELVFMVGGAEQDVARVKPVLDLMGKHVFHLGPLGSGHAMKCINNCITAITMATTAEGLLAGKRFGLDPSVMIDVLNLSTGGSWVTQHQFKPVLSRKFDEPFKLELMLKDIGIAVELARDTDTPVPLWGIGQQLWRMADHAAGPGASISEVVRWFEQQTSTELTPGCGPRTSKRS